MRESLDRRSDRGAKLIGRAVRMSLSLERDAIGGRAADGWRAAHHHGPDGFGGVRCRLAAEVLDLARQQALVQQRQAAVLPAQRVECRAT